MNTRWIDRWIKEALRNVIKASFLIKQKGGYIMEKDVNINLAERLKAYADKLNATAASEKEEENKED